MNRYFSLTQNGSVADLDIYGDITSWPWDESDVSAATLSKQLEKLVGVSQINVHINSYGGEVAEGLAIYNALRRNPAKIVTTCDGMACSIASVIFMAGDERIMSESSLLMIHNAFTFASGDAAALRKQADDVELINEASKTAYLSRISISEEELASMMDAETFILPEDALAMGFATAVEVYDQTQAVAQSARRMIIQKLTGETMLIDGVKLAATQYIKRDVEADEEAEDAEEALEATEPPDKDSDPDDPDDDPDDPDEPDGPDDPDDDPDDPDDPDKRPRAALNFARFLMKMEEK